MADVREKIKSYKAELSRLQSSYDKASGALESHMKTLKDKYSFIDVDSAEKKLGEYEKDIEKIEKKLEEAVEFFEKTYLEKK